jgi:tRNA nucleotidyltransferase/poly(A) polymerase
MVKYLHKEEGMAIKLFEVGGSIRDELMGLESADRHVSKGRCVERRPAA